MCDHAGTSASSQQQEQEDEEMQRVLALSMQTYEAEQHRTTLQPLPLQPPQQQLPCAEGLRKRCSDLPAAVNVAHAGVVDNGPSKRQRSSSSPGSASNNVPHCVQDAAGNDMQDTSSSRPTPPPQQPALSALCDTGKELETAYALVAMSHSAEHTADARVHAAATGHPVGTTPGGTFTTEPQQQGVSAFAVVTGLDRTGSVRQSPDLQVPSALLLPPQQQEQHDRLMASAGVQTEDADSADDLDMGDWEGDSIGVLSPVSADQNQPAGATGTGSNAAQGPQQQQQDPSTALDLQHIGRHLLYQLHDPVHWLDPVSRVAFTGQILSIEGQQGSGYLARRYIVDVDAPVRYVEADCEQLLPRVIVGDYVWCKPSVAVPAAWSERTACSLEQLKLVQQILERRDCCGAQDVEWLVSPWVQGCVVQSSVQLDRVGQAVPVVEVSLPCGGRCWFPVSALQLVKESGESSGMAAQPGQRQQQQGDDVVIVGSAAEGAVCGGVEVPADADDADHADSATVREILPVTPAHAEDAAAAAGGPPVHTQLQLECQAADATVLMQQDTASDLRQQQQQAAGTPTATVAAIVAPAASRGVNSCQACAGVAGAAGVAHQQVAEAQQQQQQQAMQQQLCNMQGSGLCGLLSS